VPFSLALPWTAAALWIAVVVARAAPVTRHQIGMVLAMMAVVFVTAPAARVAAAHMPSDRARWAEAVRIDEPAPSTPHPPASLPDIFYIVLDGFGRGDVLREMYGVDDAPLNAALESRGFYLARDARSNYAQTLLSLGSSLNMTYLTGLAALMPESASKLPLRHLIHHSRVARLLTEAGYRTVYIGSDYTPLSTDSVADECLCGTFGFTEFEGLLLGRTPFWISRFEQVRFAGHRRQVLRAIDHIPVAPTAQPHFVFAHVFSPHPPFVFDREGRSVVRHPKFAFGDGTHFLGTRQDYMSGYAEQVRFMSSKMIRAVDRILATRNGKDTIIILQGDHGPGSMVDWENADRTNLRERLGILLAVRLPGGPADLYPSITPVNTFRLVFSKYLGRSFAPLKDESYFSTWSKPYQFIHVPADDSAPTAQPARASDP
jgi:hypothetical protein